jgi:hypothetical protein
LLQYLLFRFGVVVSSPLLQQLLLFVAAVSSLLLQYLLSSLVQ